METLASPRTLSCSHVNREQRPFDPCYPGSLFYTFCPSPLVLGFGLKTVPIFQPIIPNLFPFLFVRQDYSINAGRQLSILPCAFQFNSTNVPADEMKIFTSPNFPGPYPRNTECHYFFYAGENEKIKIDFVYFDVEGISP